MMNEHTPPRMKIGHFLPSPFFVRRDDKDRERKNWFLNAPQGTSSDLASSYRRFYINAFQECGIRRCGSYFHLKSDKIVIDLLFLRSVTGRYDLRFLVMLGLGLVGLSAVACGTSAPTPTRSENVPAATVSFATVTPQSSSSEPAGQAVQPTAAPQTTLTDTTEYRDEYAGFMLEVPKDWNSTPVNDAIKPTSVIYSTTFYSWTPTSVSAEGIPSGETKIDVGVYQNGASSPEAALQLRKQEFANGGLDQTILSEQPLTLQGGLRATRLEVSSRFGDSIEVITAINGKTILLGGVGDAALIDAIAQTLRATES
jgi:hypothetical protein